MTLTDNLAVSMRETYADQSSSSSSSSESDDDDVSSSSSSSSRSSSHSVSSTQRMKRLGEKNSEGGDNNSYHNGELPTKPQNSVKKRTTPVTKRAAGAAAGNKPRAPKKQKTTIAPSSPPPPPPLSPPPPPPSSHLSDSSSSSSSSSLLSSDSLSSSDSDDDVVNAAHLLSLPITPRVNGTATKPDNALQVRLKIPQGFVSNQPESNADKGKQIQAAKKQRTAKEGAGKKPTVKRSKKSSVGTAIASAPVLPTQSQTKDVVGSTVGPSAGAGSFQTIPSKLIPSGPTIPLNDVRGKKELAVSTRADGADPTTAIEVDEVNIPKEFNDPFAVEAEALRNLDLFYFCDAQGHPIGLDILERPKEERPRIMGFGTVVQHLSPPERPVPVKILLPSPAFPSRKRARPVNGFTKSTSAGGRKKKSIGKNSESQSVPQRARRAATLDRHYVASDGSASDVDSNMRSDHESESDTNTGSVSHHSRQGDGSDESDTSSRRERTQLKWAGSQSSGSDDERPKSRKGKKSKRNTKQSATKSKSTSQRSLARPPTITTNNSDVNELVRSDREGIVAPKGTTQDELNLMECGFRHPQEYKRLRVFLPEITDWCLDYTDGDPTLWVITPHAWYKIAGPLSGMLPHPSYRDTFEHVRKLFEASYLVAYVLKEWLPINRKVAYRSTLLQIVELSLHGRYPVSAWFLMTNYPFIQHQITDLVADKEMYKESMFFRQLERWHEGHHLREKRTRKEKLEKEERRVQREEERLKRRQDTEEERRVKDEERKQKEVERRYPMEDLELWDEVEGDEEELDESEKEATRRKKFQFPLDCSTIEWHGLNGYLLGNVIMVWQAMSTFKSFIGMESMTLESLADCLVLNDLESNGTTNFALVSVFMTFLKVILSEKSFISPIDDVVVEGSTTVADLFGKGTTNKRTYGIGERPYGQVLSPFTWQEILRQLMAKDLNMDASIGPIEPLVGCETVRQYLYMQNNSVPFNTPVDTKQKGLEDYVQVIKNPMDLGTIKQKLESGVYEEEMNGYEAFAADVRLIWENAILYNTEQSDVGRAALALSEVFEQQYERLVIDRLAANKERLGACERVAKTLLVQVPDVSVLPTVADIVHGFSTFEFHQLPLPYKVGAMSWLCTEFLKLDSIRSLLEAHAEQEFEILREHRKRLSDVETRRKALDRKRKEKEAIFRQERIDEGIPINANNHFSEATKNEYPNLKAFYQELQTEKIADEAVYDGERKAVELELAKRLEGVRVRELPLGKDRFHNHYWVFTNDTYKRLFIEMNESGTFMLCTREDIEKLLRWLNPKGVRENELLRRLNDIKDDLINACDNVPTHKPMNEQSSLTLTLFPMASDGIIPLEPEDTLVVDNNLSISNVQLVKRMLLRTQEQLRKCRSTETSDSWDCTWRQHVSDASSREQLGALLAELEEIITTARGADDIIRTSWKRKRREWCMSLKGAHTVSQIVFLLHVLLAECINIDAFMDLSVRLDRKEWLKLRSKECRNFIPELEKHVVYFGDGHAQALKEDAKRKNKKVFTRKSDPPQLDKTLICAVSDISYYHGGGDPYALLVLETVDVDKTLLALNRDPRSHLCPEPSPLQRLARILLRIVTKVKQHNDAEPFLEPVSNRDYPEYKEIILQPMDLTTITNKAKSNTYKRADGFLEDFKLIASNCELFCEGRFPALPPRARALVELAEGLVKKSLKEIRVCEAAIEQGTDTVKEVELDEVESDIKLEVKENGDTSNDTNNLPNELTVMIRLENRLPEFLVDVKRYEQAITRTWRCGEKFSILFRDSQGLPGEYYGGVTAGSLPFDANGLLPWEALRVVWDEDDGSDDSRINPWEAELISESRKTR